MGVILFSFVFNPETKEANFTGNIDPLNALHVLQDIVVNQLVSAALEEKLGQRTEVDGRNRKDKRSHKGDKDPK
jgi:hypothetical protein